MKRMNSFVFTLLIGCVLLTGCSSNTVSTESNYSTIIGRIKNIEDSTVTLSVMNMPKGEAPDENGRQRPEDITPDENGRQRPEGDTPDGNDGQKPQLPENTETTVINIIDTTVIYDEAGSAITIDSLSEGTMITAEMDESGNAVTIRLSSPPENMGAMAGPGGGQSAPTSYESITTYSEDTDISDENYTSTGTAGVFAYGNGVANVSNCK